MEDIQAQSSIVVDDGKPISVRRKRRSTSTGSNSHPRSRSSSRPVSKPHGISTPPATPKRAKKRVRFSDPGPEIQSGSPSSGSSGLTPFIRRTTLSTPSTPPSKRRHSTPSTLWNRAEYNTPISGTLQFAPLRQVLEGRVTRRLRRNRLSEEINSIELDKRHEAKERKSEVDRLKEELAAKDMEVQSMRDEQDVTSQIGGESGTSLSTKASLRTSVQELEKQIRDLKAELENKESFQPQDANWTMAAMDPFDFDDDDDEHMITNYDENFRNTMMDDDEMITTPTRLNTSFPSPPSTMPNTPCKPVLSMNVGIQASLPIPDPENEFLKSQLQTLQKEVSKLNASIAFKDDHQTRLSEKLSDFISTDESHDHTSLDSALDTVLTQLALSNSHALEKSNALSALSTEVTSLGFSSDPEETVNTIVKQFRQARLDLEYISPGEQAEGFENRKLLGLLVDRAKVLAEKVKERDDCIDQYHSQELLLRQQLNARVSAMNDMKKELYVASTVVSDLRHEVQESEVTNERLQQALQGYRDEVDGLEKLIERVEGDGKGIERQLRSEIQEAEERLQDEVLKHDTTRADAEGKEIILIELERRLNAALQSAAEVETQLATLSSSTQLTIAEKAATIKELNAFGVERETQHGDALALRNARVSELRDEISRVNNALKTAHFTILSLRKENQDLEAQANGEKARGQFVVHAMRDQLNRVLETGLEYVNGSISVQIPTRAGSAPSKSGMGLTSATVVRRGRLMDGELARRGSGEKRKRYDSGLGFLGEDDEDEVTTEV